MKTLTGADFVEIVKCGGIFLEVFEGFFCHNLEYKSYTEFVEDMFEKRNLLKSQGKGFLRHLAKKIEISVLGGNIRNDLNEEYQCVTENWMKEKFDDMVKESFLLRIVT